MIRTVLVIIYQNVNIFNLKSSQLMAKEKIRKSAQQKYLMHSKGNHKQNEKLEWEKIFANKATNKGLISKICK